jgi:S1-C subfamily serine protease
MLGGDIIIGVENKSIENVEDLKDYINHYHKPGTPIKLRILRDLKPIKISLFY